MPSGEWTIEPTETGKFDLFQGGRIVMYDCDDVEEAVVAARRKGAEEVTVVEPDGYRVKRRL